MKPLLFGKYCLLERISVGGMAEVFRAKPFNAPGFQGYLALKKILPHLAEDDEFIKMFVDEAKLTVQLSHPNIVRIFELGQFQSSYYILMEYISGKDVLSVQKSVRKRREIFGVRTACQVAADVGSGLHHAHFMTDQNGQPLNIIHRDISPQNILVDYFGNVKVIDFGIAKAAVQSTRTQVGVLKGKMGYMSPEQVSGQKLDHRSDIFAIGTVLWELVTNRRLFNGDNEFETMNLVKEANVQAPSAYNPDIPPEVDRIILKALEADREARYPSAGALAQELQAWLDSVNYNKQELSNWMCEVYADDLAEEREKRDKFETIQTPDDVRRIIEESAAEKKGPTAGQSQVHEDKTEIWDASILPDDNEDIAAFAAQHTVVQAGGFDAAAFANNQQSQGPLAAPVVDPGLGSSPGQIPSSGPPPFPGAGQATADAFKHAGTDPGAKSSAGGGGLGALKWVLVFIVILIVGLGVTIGALLVIDGGLEGVGLASTETPPAKPGTIVVNVTPPSGIEVLVDGKSVATSSPATAPDVQPGEHVVEVKASDYKSVAKKVTVGDGELVPLEIVLEPSTPAEGRITLELPELDGDAEESFELYLDGQKVEPSAAAEGWTLPAGTHLIEARAAGARPFSQFVELERDGEETLEVKLAPAVARLSFPDGVKVRVDGKRKRDEVVELDPTDIHEIELSGSVDWKGYIGFPAMGMTKFDPEQVEQGATKEQFGWLTLSTGKDWWAVLVDGQETGLATPLTGDNKLPVRAGKRTITLRRGFAKRDIPVEVLPGETVVVRQKLEFVFDGEDGS
jgi:serine/threonine protein kinase